MSKFYYSEDYLLNYKWSAVIADGTDGILLLVLILYHCDGDPEPRTAHLALTKESTKPSFRLELESQFSTPTTKPRWTPN